MLINALAASVLPLAWLGRQGTRAVAALVLFGIAIPPLRFRGSKLLHARFLAQRGLQPGHVAQEQLRWIISAFLTRA
jgi:hypothetical protein